MKKLFFLISISFLMSCTHSEYICYCPSTDGEMYIQDLPANVDRNDKADVENHCSINGCETVRIKYTH